LAEETEVPLPLSSRGTFVYLPVRVIPRAGRSSVAGIRHGALLIRLASAPVDGAANDELVAFMAALLDIPKRQVSIATGERSRSKRVAIAGVTVEQVTAKLSAILRS
jgi:uncharacterized protein (TIGR00251 family)